MSKTIKEERLRWVLPIYNKEIKIKDASLICPYSQKSLERWLASYHKHGEVGLIPKSTKPRSNPQKTPIRIKERVIELRQQTKLCAKKLNYKLKKKVLTFIRTLFKR